MKRDLKKFINQKNQQKPLPLTSPPKIVPRSRFKLLSHFLKITQNSHSFTYTTSISTQNQRLVISMRDHSTPPPYNHHETLVKPKKWQHIPQFNHFLTFCFTRSNPFLNQDTIPTQNVVLYLFTLKIKAAPTPPYTISPTCST